MNKKFEREKFNMLKKLVRTLIPIPILLALAACSAIKLPGSSTAAPLAQPGDRQFQFDPANQPIETRLALGTLGLEGSENAVTAEQAQSLLPLWKGVKTLSAGESASQDEIDALYQQIEELMTQAQLDAIQNMGMSPEDTRALMEKYGIQFSQGNFDPNAQGTPGARPNLSEDQIVTLRAQRSQSGGNGGFSSGGQGGSFTPPDGFVPGQGFSGSGTRAQSTPQSGQNGQFNRSFRRGGSAMFVDPLILLLTERAAS